jgi:hypothetical protein
VDVVIPDSEFLVSHLLNDAVSMCSVSESHFLNDAVRRLCSVSVELIIELFTSMTC